MNSKLRAAALLVLLAFFAPLSIQAQEEEIWDPIEPVNRGIFSFNDTADIYVLEPVAKGYEKVLPQPIRKGVSNFFENIGYPSYLVSDLVQFKFGQALHHTGRFVVNTTVGVLGFIDVAKHFGLESHKEDFGVALAYHGIPAGPYLVIPIVGPSNVRDAVGRVVDAFLDPLNMINYTNAATDTKLAVTWGGKAVQVVDARASLLDAVEASKAASLDYYLFLQSSYYQYREGLLNDSRAKDDNLLNNTTEFADE